ncbi:UDP-glucosyltransferase 2-like [Coccinella septempunctata]|uniref:UDP-glucosyltransferase 2-like n=1 Tax=Coccinella septempunctata TaxID=41139 RepID=UPI001D07F258|nr:UDP-glucosyltransferase 2-like [Coccinella septempunctata]
MSFRNVLVLLFVVLVSSQSQCYNILGLFNIPSKSLHLAAITLAKILAGKGHNVTIVTPYTYSEKHENINHIFLKESAEVNERTFTNFFEFEVNPYMIFHQLEVVGVENCRLTFQDTAFQRLLQSNSKFDLVIVDPYMSLSLLYFSEHFNAPILLYSSFDASYSINPLVGNPSPPSYIPNLFLKYSSDMSFFQRLDNCFVYLMNEITLNYYSIPNHNKLVKEFFPEAPDISEYLYKATLVLLNSDVSIMNPMPKTPGMVHIGGYHVSRPKPLPQELENVMNNAKDGVILFSLGSNIKSSQMPKSRVQEILQVFSRLKETVIWKWEDENLPGKPANVIVRKWLPQNDILAHNKTKLFITHGGQHSILETVHYGVPCVSISVFMDQGANSYRAANLGYAEWIPYDDFTSEKFESAINKTLNDPRYSEMAKKTVKNITR